MTPEQKADVCSCCKGRLKSAGGFKWEYGIAELEYYN